MIDKPDDEIRKIQVTGRGSYIVSLPKKWVENVNLKRGEPIFISQKNDSSLILSLRKSTQNSEKKSFSLKVTADEDLESLIRKIIALYLNGFNTIHLQSKEGRLTPDQKNYIREKIRTKLVGIEIVTESQDSITMQVLLNYPEITMDNALRRILAISTAMHVDVIAAVKDFDKEAANSIIRMDDEVDRFSFYIIRQLKTAVQNQQLIREIGLTNPKDCLGFRLITKSIERSADHAANIARNIISMENKVTPKLYSRINEMGDFVNALLNDLEKALFRRDYGLAEEIIKRKKKINRMEEGSLTVLLKENLSPGDLSKFRIILESIRRTAEYCADIAEIILNLTIIKIENKAASS